MATGIMMLPSARRMHLLLHYSLWSFDGFLLHDAAGDDVYCNDQITSINTISSSTNYETRLMVKKLNLNQSSY